MCDLTLGSCAVAARASNGRADAGSGQFLPHPGFRAHQGSQRELAPRCVCPQSAGRRSARPRRDVPISRQQELTLPPSAVRGGSRPPGHRNICRRVARAWAPRPLARSTASAVRDRPAWGLATWGPHPPPPGAKGGEARTYPLGVTCALPQGPEGSGPSFGQSDFRTRLATCAMTPDVPPEPIRDRPRSAGSARDLHGVRSQEPRPPGAPEAPRGAAPQPFPSQAPCRSARAPLCRGLPSIPCASGSVRPCARAQACSPPVCHGARPPPAPPPPRRTTAVVQ